MCVDSFMPRCKILIGRVQVVPAPSKFNEDLIYCKGYIHIYIYIFIHVYIYIYIYTYVSRTRLTLLSKALLKQKLD